MVKIVSVDEMRTIEQSADESGLSYDQMMRNAGKSIAEATLHRMGSVEGSSVLLLVGSGNNGGDALVAGRHLSAAGANVVAYLARTREKPDPHLESLEEMGISIANAENDKGWKALAEALNKADILIDGVLGTGFRLPLKGSAQALLAQVGYLLKERDDPPTIIALDCPSGLDCDSGEVADETLPADLTVSLAAAKPGLLRFPGANKVGELVIGDIGLDPQLGELAAIHISLVDPDSLSAELPERPRDAHKGTFGTVLVVAGCVNYPGAAALAALGAYRIGAGLVTLAVPSPVQSIIAPIIPEATWLLLPHDMGVISESAVGVITNALRSASSVLIGPGFGTENTTMEFLRRLLGANQDQGGRQIGFIHPEEGDGPGEMPIPACVIDADGLKLLSMIDSWYERLPAGCVLTPHPGEMSVMTGVSKDEIQNDRVAAARRWSAEWGHIVVLKGAYTIVAAPDGRVRVVPFATATMAKAGTGDVLAGVIAGLRAQGLAPFEAGWVGAYLHGYAGQLAEEAMGTNAGLLAGDLSEYLPAALRDAQFDRLRNP